MTTKRRADEMSQLPAGEDQDPDYEMVTTMTSSKRMRLLEQDAKEVTVKRIEMIIRKQFDIEMRHKEKEVILIDERIHQTRAILDKLRGCIVASYYGNVSSYPALSRGEQSKQSKLDLHHPAITRVIKQTQTAAPQVTSSGISVSEDTSIAAAAVEALIGNGDLVEDGASSRPETPVTPMLNGDISELLSGCSTPDSEKLSLSDSQDLPSILTGPKGPRNTGQNTFGVGPALPTLKPTISQAQSEDGSRFHVKKRIIVGNVSKYIAPENREDSDPSTHKWMVYVRGPHDEPRIDHFVKKIWIFLHPSYRPNDLVEVKEPPFHLTRRGWGEFPIRVQLHFVDPRNKKVDIIHHLKLDRTYTGLQTLGAETIVDVELDRYLFDEAGQPVSRPSTPTVTSVKYKEGCKPEPTSPGASVVMPTTPSPALPDFRSLTPSTPMETSPAVSPPLPGSLKGTPTPDIMLPPSTKGNPGITLGTMNVKEQGHAISGEIGAGGILTRTLVKPLTAAASVGGQLAIQQQQGGRFVRVMPPLGPITSQVKTAGIMASTIVAKSPLSVVTQTSDAIVATSKCATTEGDKTSKVISPNRDSSPPSTTGSPTTTAVNVAEVAASTSPGKGAAMAVRIQEGKLVADVSSTAVQQPPVKLTSAAIAAGLPSTIATPPTITQIAAPTAGQIQNVPKVSPPLAQGVASTLQMAGAAMSPLVGGKLPVAAPPKPGSAGGIKVIPTRPTALSSPTHGGASTSFPIIPNPPPGTQYYITAKSTDPNLQGKVILIPQQVFAQASGQSVLVGSKGGRPGASQIQGKGGAALKPTPATKSSFLSPSNVLILPQGSIVPPLPPGSIVQIQQVPSPNRSTPPQPPQLARPRLAVAQKSASAPALVGAKTQTPRIAGMPSGGIIQIQRTTGPSVTKVFPSQLGGSTVAAASSSSGISILPEKGTLAKTPSGGVVFVQRSPSTGKLNAQPVTGISVAGQSGIPQKVALAAQLAGAGTLKPGSTVSIIQGPPGKPVVPTGQTVVLQSPSSLPKLQQVKTIQQPIPRSSQPIILGQSSVVRQVQPPGQSQPPVSSEKGKVQLVSIKQEKLPEKLVTSEIPPLPVGQTPMPLSHEVTITTTDSPSAISEEESSGQSSQDGKTEPMEVDTATKPELPKTNELESQKLILKQEHVVKVEPASSEPPVSAALEKQSLPIVASVATTVPQPTAVVTSHGLVQVQVPTVLAVTTTQSQTVSGQHQSSMTTSSSTTATLSSSSSVTTLQGEKIQIKQEVLSPPRAAASSIILSPIAPVAASSVSLVSITTCPIMTSSAPMTTLLTTSTASSLLGPRLAANSTTVLRPVAGSTILGPSSIIARPAASAAAPMLLSQSISSTLLRASTPRTTILRPNTATGTIISSAIPSTILGPSTIGGQQTIIVTSTNPAQVISFQKDGAVKSNKEPEDPLLIELQRRSREGPVSVYGVETMEQLVRLAVEKIPLVLSNRVQSDHPYTATTLEHFYSWSVGKRRAAEWQRALAVKGLVKDAAVKLKKLKDVPLWSTKKLMWWCRRHGYTPADPGSAESKPTRQWCNVCGEVEMPVPQQDNEENVRHDCTAKWMSTSGLLQNTSYTVSDEFVKTLQDKQHELGRDDDDSDIEIDVININKEPRKVQIKKEPPEVDTNRIKCYLPPSDGARLVTDTAHEIGVQFKPVPVAEDTYASVTQEMVIAATKRFMSDLVRGAFANAYGNRKDHRFPEEILPTHIFQKVKEEKTFDFLTNKYLGIPMPERDDSNRI